MEKTLKEAGNIVGMTRRVIQEYEKAGLVAHSSMNKYGHLLYDDAALERLWQIRFYRELEYSKDEIMAIMNDPSFDKKKSLENQIEMLTEKKENIEKLIENATFLKETGIGTNTLRFNLRGLENLNYNDLFNLFGSGFNTNILDAIDEDDNYIEKLLEQEEIGKCEDALEKMIDLCDKGLAVSTTEVQSQIKIIHGVYTKICNDSIIVFSLLSFLFFNLDEMISVIDREYGDGKAKYCNDAIQYYCSTNTSSKTDEEFIKAMDNIVKLGRKKYTTSSDEVQDEVKKIHDFYYMGKALSDKGDILALLGFGESLDKQDKSAIFVKYYGKGALKYISKAIRIYCNNFDNRE